MLYPRIFRVAYSGLLEDSSICHFDSMRFCVVSGVNSRRERSEVTGRRSEGVFLWPPLVRNESPSGQRCNVVGAFRCFSSFVESNLGAIVALYGLVHFVFRLSRELICLMSFYALGTKSWHIGSFWLVVYTILNS